MPDTGEQCDGEAGSCSGLRVCNPLTCTCADDDLIFRDGFEAGDLSAWSKKATDGGDAAVTDGAALAGDKGLALTVDDAAALFARDDTPAREGHYRARFTLDPNSISMRAAARLTIFSATSREPVGKPFKLQLRKKDRKYQVLLQVLQPPASPARTAWLDIPDGPTAIEIEWLRARSASAHDGLARIWIGDTQVAELPGLGNGTLAVDDVKLGAPAGADGTTRGTLYIDHFEARRHTYIGP